MEITDIKTFEDACKVERINAKKVLPKVTSYPKKDQAALLAHAKLVIIARAINKVANNGKAWKPDWNNDNQYKYYAFFYMGGSSGFRYRVCVVWFSYSLVGSRLCFISREAAEYAGKQFEKLYKDYFVM
jgi:hypothetical protein